ncbi:MAG: hypothetical protein IJ564_06340 [Alphaproteobacteria bacterium]|nr:hypothetical protein [Alphaproteobacteria bacterium]
MIKKIILVLNVLLFSQISYVYAQCAVGRKHCASCSGTWYCGSCEEGYILDWMRGDGCYTCQELYGSHCKQCGGGRCIECEEGYAISMHAYTLSQACVPCKNGVCQQCPSGKYYENDYNNCLSCGTGCQECTNTGRCSECKEGYLFKNYACVSKNNGCGAGFLLFGNKCIPEKEGCGDNAEAIDGVCVYKIRYTVQEADALTSSDNENYIEWVFD